MSSSKQSKLSSGITDLNASIPNPPAWLERALGVEREDGFIEVDGCQIHYFRWGDPSKPGILMMHGFLAHARCFAFIAPFLANDYHIIAFDFSGMGDSSARTEYSEDVRVSEMMGVARETGLFDSDRKPTIIAHSYGCRVGVAAVTHHPERFAGLIICDLMIIRPEILKAHASSFSRPGNQNPDKPNKIYPDFETAQQRFVLAPKQKVEEQSLFDYMAYHSLKQVNGGWTWKFDPSVFKVAKDEPESWSKAGEELVAAPGRKAVIYGAQSVLFTEDSEDYLREIGGNNMPIIEIPNARHHLMLDQPIAFACVLQTVLEQWRIS